MILVSSRLTPYIIPNRFPYLLPYLLPNRFSNWVLELVWELAWDQVSSALDGRESAFELNASGGMPAWRARMRAWFEGYDDLANNVRSFIKVELPPMDLDAIRNVPNERARTVTPPADASA